MLGRALGIKPLENADLSAYGDNDDVSDWAAGYVAALTEAGIVNGVDGNLNPDAEIDRAATMTILDRAITTYVTEPGTTIEANGGIIVVAAEDVTITGEANAVVITEAAAEGTTKLENADVGTVTVQAADTSVVLGKNSTADSVEMTKQAAGTEVEVAKGAAVGTVTTAAPESTVSVSGTVGTVETTETAANTKVEAAAGSTVTNVDNKADGTTVSGAGKVENVTTSGDNTSVNTNGTKVEATEGTNGTTAGSKPVTGGDTATTTPSAPPVHYCTVVKTEKIDPTCTEGGYTKYTTCCGAVSYGEHVPATGHKDGEVCCDGKIHVYTVDGLKKAFEEVQDGSYIVMMNNIEQADGVLIADTDLTVDLNGKTFTVTDGASTNNRNFKITGDSVVTIKNGTLIAAGELTSGAYGTVRTEGTAKAILTGLKLYSYRGYGLNVKANTGSTIIISDTEIYAQYSGGVEAAGGNIELNNVTIDQKGVYSGAAWCSVGIGVNGGGKVTVNSGTYSAAAIETDSNAAQGTWVAYVMSSGGTLEINGGTFTSAVAETANAANACGIICADRAAIVDIYGGTFNSNGAILDMRNNVGTQPNPVATLKGGTYSADPRVSGLYSSNLIKVAAGYEVKNEDGTWTVVDTGYTVDATGNWTIRNADGLQAFANEVNVKNNKFTGKSVKLTADIDLGSVAWTPIGQTGATQFRGTFDGQNYTISNLNIDSSAETGAHYSSGLFGWLNSAIVKNVKIDGAVVKGNHNCGVIAGYLETAGCTIENCHVSDAGIICTHANDDACGDKAGVIVGHAGNTGVVVKDCTASSSTVAAGRDAGQIVGAALTANVSGCSATNVSVSAIDGCTGANIKNEVIGRVLG